ncbi:MAG: amidase, partial [Gemmataceae bacterium]
LGTQTGGSTIRPASYCGVCALKPTWGRVSVDGVLPLAPSLDHIGVMANCVRDLAIVFEVIAGDDRRDSSCSTRPVSDCLRRIDQAVVPPENDEELEKLMRPGACVPTGFFEPVVSSEVLQFFEQRVRDFGPLSQLEAFVRRITLPPGFADIHRLHRVMMSVEAAQVHAARMTRHPDDYPPRIRELIEDGLRATAVEYREARLFRDNQDDDCANLFWPEPLLMPATADLPPTSETTGNPWCNSPWSFLGVPAVSLPLGWSEDGLPMAIQYVGASWHEEGLLAMAARVERVFAEQTSVFPRRLPPVPVV